MGTAAAVALWGIPLCMCMIVPCLFSYQTLQGSLRVRVCFLTVHVHRVSVHTWKHVLAHVCTRSRVYYGMCCGSARCVEGVYALCKRIFSLRPVAKT